MAEIISIKVNVNDTDYKRTTGRLLEIQKYVDTLNKTPIHIKIDNAGFDKVTKQITAYNNSVARMVKAENELTIAKEKTAQAQAKAEAEAWKAEQADIRRSAAREAREARAAAATQKRIETEEKLKEQAYLEAEKHRQDQVRRDDKALADAEKRAQKEAEAFKKSYEQQAQAAEKHRQEQIKRDQQAAAEAEKNAQRQAAAQEKAAGSVDTLRKNYANLLRQIENLKAKYPEGTFDDIEREAKEAGAEVRHLDTSSKTLVDDVDRLSKTYKKLNADLAQTKTEHKAEVSAMNESAAASALLNNSLGNLILQYFSLRNIVNHLVSAFRDALNTMKEVDSELVTIQKTTGYSGERLDRLTNSAYELASAYGRTATEILNAASVYARAGFKENLEDMTELSALLQNVGDLTGEAAAKFLVATNAAWQMNGSYENLLRVIDGLNQQTNEAAVDMEALTSGITVAGSVFSNAGESVQTFAGLLGAGVALTQRSGSEIGRGLRTIAMNIRQIKGELDDGEIIDEASISDAAEALHSVGISVADANGELRLTSDVLTDLANKWGSLTSAEQSYLSQSLAGKRQANILNALMNNWQEVERQMTLYANGAGSAMKENEIYLDSWEAKTKQLDAAWTEFVANLVDTDLIKGALDALITLVNLLDSDFGHFLVTAVAIPTVLLTIASLIGKITAAVGLLGTALMPILGVVAGGVAIAGLVALADALTTSAQEYADAVKEAEDAYARTKGQIEDLKRKESELTDIERHKLELLQQQERIQLDELRRSKAAQYQNLYGSRDASLTANDLVYQYQMYSNRIATTTDIKELEKLEQGLANVRSKIHTTLEGLKDFQVVLGADFPKSGREAIQTLEGFERSLDSNRTKVQQTSEEWLEAGRKAFSWMLQTDEAAEAIRRLEERLKAVSEKATSYDTVIAAVINAMENFGAESYEVNQAMKNLETIMPGSTAKMYDFDTATITTKEDIFGSKAALLDFIDTQKQLEFSSAISQLEELAASYWDVAGAALAAMNAQAAQQMAGVLSFTGTDASMAQAGISSQLAGLKSEKAEWDAYVATLRARSSYKPDTSGRGSYTPVSSAPESTTDEELVKRQKIVELLKAELAFLKASGASTEDIVAKQKEIQAALHEEAEYLRGTQAYLDEDADTLVSVKNLSTEWWDIQAEINKLTEKTEQATEDELNRLKAIVAYKKQELAFLQASGASEEAIAAKRKEIQAALHDQAEEMRRILAVMKEQGASEADITAYEREILALSTEWWNIQEDINKALEKQKELQQEMFDTLKKQVDEYYAKLIEDKEKELTLEERILAVQQAEAALANAQRERTVRYYNAATGQWEWQANAKNVKSAQDALKKAQDDLNKYQRDQAWKEFKSAWEYVSEQIKAGAMTFQEAYDYMYREMKRIQDTYGVDLGGTLEDSIGGFKHLNYGIDGLTQEVANSLGASVAVLDERLKQYETAVGALKDAFYDASEKVKRGEMTMEDAYSYLRDRAKEIADKYGIDMTGALEEAIAGMDKTNMSIDDLWKAVILNLMKVNSARWFDANDEEKARLHAQNEYLGKLIGATYDPSGYWYLNGSRLYESQRGVDYSGKTSGWGNYTGSGSGTGYSGGSGSGGGSSGGVSYGGGGGGSGGGSFNYTGSNEIMKSSGKYYDSYGREYETLDDAVKGNAAGVGGTNAGKPMTNGTGFLAAEGRIGKITYGLWGVRVADAEENTHWLDPDHGYFKSSNGYIYDTTEATDYELARHGLYRTELGGKTVTMPIPSQNAAGFAANMDKLRDAHIAQTGSDVLSPDELYGPDDNDTHGAPANARLGSTKSGYKSSSGSSSSGSSSSWDSMMTLGEDDISRSGGGYSNDTPSAPASSGTVNYVTVNTTGDTYIIDGVRIGEEQARSTTIYDLARLAGDLGQYKGAV